MKQAIQPGADVAPKTAGLVRSRSPQTAEPDGHLIQLAAMMNSSPRALAQPNDAIQHSPRVQSLMNLATEINQNIPAQLRSIPVNDDAGLEHEADVMGAKALTTQHPAGSDSTESSSGDSLDNVNIQDDLASQGPNSPVQRVRILLRDVDKVLMGRLRLVPVANPGAETLQDPVQVGTLQPIGANESIVLEGHGHEDAPLFGAPRVVSQGGIAPPQLATLARNVPKPDNWTGNIVLLGCSTGSITAAVSEEYFKLARTPVKVIGTRTNIRVGTKENGTNFIGSDWSREPVDQRPADLAFVDDLLTANKEFIAAVQQLSPVYRALDSHVKGVPMAIPHSVNQIEARGLYIIDVESLSDHKGTAVPNRRYAKPSRIEMSRLFREVFSAIYKVAFFRPPSTVNPIVNALAARTQVDEVLDALRTLSVEGMRLYTEVDYELHGYKLKEIDLTSNVSAQHSKRRRTAESIFGDTWVDEP